MQIAISFLVMCLNTHPDKLICEIITANREAVFVTQRKRHNAKLINMGVIAAVISIPIVNHNTKVKILMKMTGTTRL